MNQQRIAAHPDLQTVWSQMMATFQAASGAGNTEAAPPQVCAFVCVILHSSMLRLATDRL